MNPMMGTKFTAPEDHKSNWTHDYCKARVTEVLGYVESVLGEREHFVGESLSLADIAISTALGVWQGALGQEAPPSLAAHRKRMQSRPAYQRAVTAFRVK